MSRFLKGPSPPKDSPQARFRDNVLGIRTRLPIREAHPEKPSEIVPARFWTMQAPAPFEPTGPSAIFIEVNGSSQPTVAHARDSSVAPCVGQSSGYGRLSPPPPSGGGPVSSIPPANEMVVASSSLATQAIGFPVGPNVFAAGSTTAGPTGPAGFYFSTGREHTHSLRPADSYAYPAAPAPQGATAGRGAGRGRSRMSSNGSPRESTLGQHATYTKLLSLECQLRRFNPQWEEKEISPGAFKCLAILKGTRLTTDTSFYTPIAAKQATARLAYKIVRSWPLEAVVPEAIKRVAEQVKAGLPTDKASHTMSSPTHVVIKREESREPQSSSGRDVKGLLEHIEAVVGDMTPSEVKTNPIAAKAYMAGFSMGARCAGMAASDGQITPPKHLASASRAMRNRPRNRSRSRSPRRRHSPRASYRERPVAEDWFDRASTDRYRPA